MRPVIILESPSNLGLREPSPGQEPGVSQLPAWLRKHGFHDLLSPTNITTLEPPAYGTIVDPQTKIRNTPQLVDFARRQAATIMQLTATGQPVIMLGGDCSILIGAMLGLKQAGRYGLFFLDGHTDYMDPKLSQSAGAAGMDLALVCGFGHDILTNINGLKPYVEEELVFCAGNRELDEDYVQYALDSRIYYYDLIKLRLSGLATCAITFLEQCKVAGVDGFWIHFDVDVLDDTIMPAVDSRQPDGLNYNELGQVLLPLLSHEKFTGISISILDPDLDPEGNYTRNFVEAFAGICAAAKLAPLHPR